MKDVTYTIAKESIEYLSPFIEIKETELKNKYNVEDLVKNKLTNVQSVCLYVTITKIIK